MEDRYEILGKIGQGGLGAVYRGFDKRMSREVAIKRISAAENEDGLLEESTKQLVIEAGALASLQHPNIVTIHDVGSDEDGPYVVMELINGKTLDELIERAPLTWPDFRELALQTQEALIAAQERNIIHSDLKPSNLMLTWLPSGKFQIKVVDFGLASLAQSQSKHDLEAVDCVFGSIFFMPPEQFERTPLDMRSDMYSIGCVFYQALTGHYPFNGTSGNEVMEAHLHHQVAPLRDVRAGIPLWACDWIMWHINRYPQDRPESARDSLSLFLQNDRIPNPPLSTGVPPTPIGPPRSKVRTPVTMQQSAPAAPQPPAGPPRSKVRPPAPQAIPAATLVQTSQVALQQAHAGAITQTAPQPLAPPEGFKPSVHSAGVDTAPVEITAPQAAPTPPRSAATQPSPSSRQASEPAATQSSTRKTPAAKTPTKANKKLRLIILISAVAFLLASSFAVFKIIAIGRDAKAVEAILTKAEVTGTKEIPLDDHALQSILHSLTKNPSDSHAQRVCAALAIAKATDATDIDTVIANFVTQGPTLPPRTRESIIRGVLLTRSNPAIISPLSDLAFSNTDPDVIVASLQAVRPLMGDEHFAKLINLLASTTNNQVMDACEANITEILRRTGNLEILVNQLTSAKDSNTNPDVLRTLQRLKSFADSIKLAPKK